jgi:hypothetical protein
MKFDDIALDFFKTFARFEYALKDADYHCGNGEAKPDWCKFAKSVETLFEESSSEELRAAMKYFMNDPPKKQVVKDGKLDWDDCRPSGNLKSDLVLTYVRRVRNNLFHGGKFHKHLLNSERNEKLMTYSLVVLKHCLQASPKVDQFYQN